MCCSYDKIMGKNLGSTACLHGRTGEAEPHFSTTDFGTKDMCSNCKRIRNCTTKYGVNKTSPAGTQANPYLCFECHPRWGGR